MEQFSIASESKAEDYVIDTVATKRVTAIAEAEAFAKIAERDVLMAGTEPSFDGDLVRPASVDCCLAEFAFSVGHACPPFWGSVENK